MESESRDDLNERLLHDRRLHESELAMQQPQSSGSFPTPATLDAALAENARLRELYENAVGNRERFGWTINHLLECEEALRMAEAGQTNRVAAAIRKWIGEQTQVNERGAAFTSGHVYRDGVRATLRSLSTLLDELEGSTDGR